MSTTPVSASVSAAVPMPPPAPPAAPRHQPGFTFTVPAVSGAGGLSVGGLVVWLLMNGQNPIATKPVVDTECHCAEEIEEAFEEIEDTVQVLARDVEWLERLSQTTTSQEDKP